MNINPPTTPGPEWERLLQEREYLLGYAARIVAKSRPELSAEDLVSSTLHQGYQHFKELKNLGSLRPWLCRILRRRAGQELRQKRRELNCRDQLSVNWRVQIDTTLGAAHLENPRLLQDLAAQRPALIGVANAVLGSNGWETSEAAEYLGLSKEAVRRNLQAFRDFSLKWFLTQAMNGANELFDGSKPVSIRACISAFTELAKVAGFERAAKWLRQCSGDAWHRFEGGSLRLETVAVAAAATAKVHQQCGRSEEAAAELTRLFQHVPLEKLRKLSAGTADTVLGVNYRLLSGGIGGENSRRTLEAALELNSREARERFRWRMGLNALMRGERSVAQDLLKQYEQSSGSEKIAKANIRMVRTFEAVLRRDWDQAVEMTRQYRSLQEAAWAAWDIPDPGVHGVLTAFYLQAEIYRRTVRDADARDALSEFLTGLARFRVEAGIGIAADGMQETSAMLEFLLPMAPDQMEEVAKQDAWQPPKNQSQFDRICAIGSKLDTIVSSVR